MRHITPVVILKRVKSTEIYKINIKHFCTIDYYKISFMLINKECRIRLHFAWHTSTFSLEKVINDRVHNIVHNIVHNNVHVINQKLYKESVLK